jgi:hypothetical protein
MNKNHFKTILILLLLLTANCIIAQETYSEKADSISFQTLPIEKIFLHIDRPNYIQGDTIWFKAYIWFGYNQVPDTVSKILHVDLISPSGQIENSLKLLILNGTSNGEFYLDKNIKPGTYTLRAYTRWMQNPNTGEPFYQDIRIDPISQNFIVDCIPKIRKESGKDSLYVSFNFFELDQSGEIIDNRNHRVFYSFKTRQQLIDTGQFFTYGSKTQIFKYRLSEKDQPDSLAIFNLSINDNLLTFNKQFDISLQDAIDIQFLPEGGKLVNGLISRVAFKAIGIDGLSREVNGTIQSQDGSLVTNFKTFHKGMGTLIIKPEHGKKYSAHLWFAGRNYIIPLPPADDKGSVMTVTLDENSKNLNLAFKQSNDELITQKYIAASAYGKVIFISPINVQSDSCTILIPKDLLPEGVIRLTVFNNYIRPECERLLYVDKYQSFKISVKPDSLSYSNRSKVSLSINAKSLDGNPVQADLSISVVDKGQITGELHGISAYKLLESELQGYIEDVDYYFNNDSCVNLNDLDLVLLTHGYRRFITDSIQSTVPQFLPERNHEVSGKIIKSGNSSRANNFNYSNLDLIFMCPSKKPFYSTSNPDSLGLFSFNVPLQYGDQTSLLQATTSKGKPFLGDLLINDSIQPPKFNRTIQPTYNIRVPFVEYVNQLQAAKKTLISNAPWEGAMSATLGEVIVTANAKNWYQNFEKDASKIADLDLLDPSGKKYAGLNDLLVQEFGAIYHMNEQKTKTILLPAVSARPNMDPWYPIYVINGKTFLDDSEPMVEFYSRIFQLSTFPVNEIKKIMVIPPGDISAHYASPYLKSFIRQSLIVIETYSNNTFRGDPTGIKTFILDGLDTPRSFYSPIYEGPSKTNKQFDGRATVYWNPSFRTNSNGNANVSFYTNDRSTQFEIVINGTENMIGSPGQFKGSINNPLN